MSVPWQNHRRNGWQWPPHPLQVAAWVVTAVLAAFAIGFLTPCFKSVVLRVIFFLILGILICMVIVTNLIVTTIDPADDAIKLKIRDQSRPVFDRARHAHVINDDFFCNICEDIVHPSSKHCRQCNKCVLDFDHHCKWLNNCVGAKNYRWFFIYVTACTFTAAWLTLQSLAALILVHTLPDTLNMDGDQLQLFGAKVSKGGFLACVVVILAVSGITFGLTIHLCVFHIRLVKHGLTTYKYIMEERRRDEEKRKTMQLESNGWMNGTRKKTSGQLAEVPKIFSARGVPNGNLRSNRPSSADSCPRSARTTKVAPLAQINGGTATLGDEIQSPSGSFRSSCELRFGLKSPDNSSVRTVNSYIAQDGVRQPSYLSKKTVESSVSNGSSGLEAPASGAVVPLPKILDPRKRTKKIFEPAVESVLTSADKRELFLPSIMVKSPSDCGDAELESGRSLSVNQ